MLKHNFPVTFITSCTSIIESGLINRQSIKKNSKSNQYHQLKSNHHEKNDHLFRLGSVSI